jgi:site-specific DNA-methyltransferase (cytosine-N4-specific)
MLENIEYRKYHKRDDIHGTILYPAVMVAPIQKEILNKLIVENDINSIFDPFHGSGTSLYEAMEIQPGLHLIGCDINPLANLITKVKLQGVPATINQDLSNLQRMVNTTKCNPEFCFPNSTKWFREDIVESLAILRAAIMGIENQKSRQFFWYMMCDVIRRHSNTRSATYKLHIKEDEAIKRIENRVIESFFSSVKKNLPRFQRKSKYFTLYKCDILEKFETFQSNAFDISITSPPYGDNATTVPYGEFSMLALYTIDSKDLNIEGWELENYSRIDSRSIGGRYSPKNMGTFEANLIEPYLSRISEKMQKKVIRFFGDYFIFLNELCRVTKKYIVLTLGHRTVDRVQINLTAITRQFLEANQFANISYAQRDIPTKRIPKITSMVNDRPVSSMNCEHIIIHVKK